MLLIIISFIKRFVHFTSPTFIITKSVGERILYSFLKASYIFSCNQYFNFEAVYQFYFPSDISGQSALVITGLLPWLWNFLFYICNHILAALVLIWQPFFYFANQSLYLTREFAILFGYENVLIYAIKCLQEIIEQVYASLSISICFNS